MAEPKRIDMSLIMGSKSDARIIDESRLTLVFAEMEVKVATHVISAHRNNMELRSRVSKDLGRGAKLFVCAAGMATALAGDVAAMAMNKVPVVGVPLPSTEFPNCLDALLSMVRMPPGTAVIVPGIGKSGLYNAGIVACQILAPSKGDAFTQAFDEFLHEKRREKPPMIGVNVCDLVSSQK